MCGADLVVSSTNNSIGGIMSSQKRLWNDTARYENALDQAVRFVARLSTLTREVVTQADEAVSGRNKTVRDNSAVAVQKKVSQLITETEHWNHVIETMQSGKDVHLAQNCKGSKLEIVGGSEPEFGQYLIDQSDGKFCEENPDRDTARVNGMPFRGNVTGHKYIEKTTGEKTEPHYSLKLTGGKSE